MTRRSELAARRLIWVIASSLLVLVAVCAPATAASGRSADRFLPSAGATVIVPPPVIEMVAPRPLLAAWFTVHDGCGRVLPLPPAELAGAAATAALQPQDGGPGTWQVAWSVRESGGAIRSGTWSFVVARGKACPARASALSTPVPAAAPPAGTGHHGQLLAAGPATAGGVVLAQHPLLAFGLGLLAVLVLAASGLIALRGQLRRRPGRGASGVAVVVLLLTVVLGISAAADGSSLLARLALSVPGAVLISGCVASVVAQLRHRVVRFMIAGMCAAPITVGVTVLLASARSMVLAIPADQAFAALPGQVVSAAAAVAVLAAVGWLPGLGDNASRSAVTPQLGGPEPT